MGWVQEHVFDPISEGLQTVWDGVVDLGQNIIDFVSESLQTIWKEIGYPIIERIFAFLGFEDQTIYLVQVTTVKLLEDQEVKNKLIASVISSVKNDTDIVDNIKQQLLTGYVNSLNLYANEGKNNFIYGLPTATSVFNELDTTELDIIITDLVGEDVEIANATLAFPRDTIWVKYYLQENRGYSEKDQIISQGGIDWLYDGFTKDSITLKFTVNLRDGTNTTTLDELIDSPNYAMYYNVVYTLDSDPTYSIYFLYQRDLGTYPSLDSASAASGINQKEYNTSEMYPIVPIRKDFVNVGSDTESEEYKSSKKLLRILNISIDDLTNQINSIGDSDSPDDALSNIEDAFVLFGVNLYADTNAEKKALYMAFQIFYVDAQITKTDYDNKAIGDDAKFNTFTVIEQNYNQVIKFDYITSTVIDGCIGPKGTYETEIFVLPNRQEVRNEEDKITQEAGVDSYIIIKNQVSDTQYNELLVHGLFLMVNIKTKAETIKTSIIELFDNTADENYEVIRNNFNILLSNAIIESNTLTNFEKDQIIQNGLIMVIYATQTIHLRWYETRKFNRFFSVVLEFAAVVLLIISIGASTQISAYLWAVGRAILIQYALTIILTELLIRYADDDNVKLLILVAYVAASYYNVTGAGDLTNAESLLSAVNALSQVISIDTAIQADLLQKEIDAFLVSSEERQEEIDKATEFLENTSGLEFWELQAYLPINVYETPGDFYTRTIHTGNPGVLSLSQIENYHENLLKLPELDVHSFDPVSIYN